MADLTTLLSKFLTGLYTGTATLPANVTIGAYDLTVDTDLLVVDASANTVTTSGSVGIGTSSLTSGAKLTVSGKSTLSDNMNIGGTDLTRRFMVTGGTVTTALSPVYITQTCNAAAVAFPGIKFVMTEGGSGTAAGTNLLDLWYGTSGAEASKFSVGKAGSLSIAGNFSVPSGNAIFWSGRGKMASSADGTIELSNAAITGFTTLNLGPTAGNTANGTWQLTKSTITVAAAAGPTLTAAGASFTPAIPAGVRVAGVTTTNLVGFGATSGLTSYKCGDGVADIDGVTDVDRWGATVGITQGAGADFTTQTAGAMPVYASAPSVVLTGNGGNFDTTGSVSITVYYFRLIKRAVS